MIEVVHYVGDDGADYFDRWLCRQSADTRARIQTRIDRIEFGNLEITGVLARASSSCASTSGLATACTSVGMVMRL